MPFWLAKCCPNENAFTPIIKGRESQRRDEKNCASWMQKQGTPSEFTYSYILEKAKSTLSFDFSLYFSSIDQLGEKA